MNQQRIHAGMILELMILGLEMNKECQKDPCLKYQTSGIQQRINKGSTAGNQTTGVQQRINKGSVAGNHQGLRINKESTNEPRQETSEIENQQRIDKEYAASKSQKIRDWQIVNKVSTAESSQELETNKEIHKGSTSGNHRMIGNYGGKEARRKS